MNSTPASGAPRIGVIETGLVPDELAGQYPDYVQRVRDWLTPGLPEASFEPLRLISHEPLCDPGACAGYVITGSKHGAYEDLLWIAALEAFVRECYRARIPVFGICFGHQVMAQAFGARVVKAENGWGVGTQRYALSDLSGGAEADVPVYVFHQDQVVDVPAGAEVVGGSDFCPIGALRYEPCALSVQFHPEFDGEFVSRLLDVRAGLVVPQDKVELARRSLADRPDNAAIGAWAAAFFRANWAAAPASTAQRITAPLDA